MPVPDHEQLRRIFDLAFDATASERATVLDRECAGDAQLRERVEAMLAGAADERFLVEPTIARTADSQSFDELKKELPGEQPGDRIGDYKLLQKIGEGGFGVVFLAEQEQPVRRRVALKIIKLGMDTRQVVARFEQERQALAVMDHPNIAKVFDAGATSAGRPYFVMEFCAGTPITEYCDRNSLSIAERLKLLVQVCQATQHAHQKGLIHRDIKPSNVLIVIVDGQPQVKVIDFGIAKAVTSPLTEKTLVTELRQLVGTPQYMSPEQAAGSLDIDTRTDVYSLGVLCYELLTGTTPFTSEQLRSAAYGEIHRIIRESEPPKPSTRISQITSTVASVAALRKVEPAKLGTIVRGELDWIVMKALEKDRARRYESPNALGFDLQRYLSGEAVQAAPPSRSYQFRKFVKRNKGPVTAAAAVAVALLAGITAFAWQAQVAGKERDRAIKAEGETAERAAELQKVSDFQFQMLSQVDPASAGLRLTSDVRSRFDGALTKAGMNEAQRTEQSAAFNEAWSRINATDTAQELIKSTILAPALDAIDRQFHDDPKIDARLRSAISSRYIDLGLYEDSLAVFDQLRATRERAFGPDHADTIDAIVAKCKVLTLLGRASESESILRPLVETQRAKLGADNVVVLRGIEFLGEALTARTRFAEAEALFRESLAGRKRVLGDDHEDTLMSIGNLSMALRGQAKYAEAESLTRDLLERRRRIYGENNNYTLSSYNNLATILLDEGRFLEAVEFFKKSADGRRQLLGEVHRETIVTTNNLAAALGRLNRHAEAETIQRELLERTQRVLGPDHPDTLMILSNLVGTLIELGKLDEAEPLCRESLTRRLRVFGPASAGAVTGNNMMSFLLRRQKKDAEAETYLRAAIDASKAAWGDDHPERLVLLLNMGVLARDRGRLAESEQVYREVFERSNRALGAVHPYALMAVTGLGETLFVEKKYVECVKLFSDAESNFRSAAAKMDQGDLRVLLLGMGKARTELKDFTGAEANLVESYALYLAARGPDGKGTQRCVQLLVDLYGKWQIADPAGRHQDSVAEWRARLTQPSSQPATAPVDRRK